MKTIKPEIEALLETMHEQFMQIKQYEGNIPQIEFDILLSNLRKTYEYVSKLNKINLKEELNTLSVNALKKEINSSFTETKQEETAPVIAQKESTLKLKSTTLPFDIPQINFFKKETTPATQDAKTEQIIATKESTLKLKSTTFPFDIPPTDNPSLSVPEQEIPAPVQDILQEPIDAKKEIEVVMESDNTTLSFEIETTIKDQEALNISREKIYKEESFVQKINPLSKIASLFDDGVSVHEKSRESFSILDKFIKKKEDTSLIEMLKHTPISDLKSAIGINEKFQFINELFGGNYEDYNASIDLLNKCKSFTDAEIFIAENIFDKYTWEAENRNVADFMDLVERRFL